MFSSHSALSEGERHLFNLVHDCFVGYIPKNCRGRDDGERFVRDAVQVVPGKLCLCASDRHVAKTQIRRQPFQKSGIVFGLATAFRLFGDVLTIAKPFQQSANSRF